MTYALLSDLHLHNWSAFEAPTEDGINSRLAGLLNEIDRAAAELRRAGGNVMVFAGDLFHVRGSIAPSVLNPTKDRLKAIIDSGIEIVMIPGNHDLEGKHTTRLGSAVTSMESIGVRVVHEPSDGMNIAFMPWIDKLDELKAKLQELASRYEPEDLKTTDLVIHAPVNGVIMGIPDNGLDAPWLAKLGFKRVFSGHYHNHVHLVPGVYSIGALAHHTWGDIGSKAGFLIVRDDMVTFEETKLPQFVEAAGADLAEIAAKVRGNYARVKISSTKLTDIEAMKKFLADSGAIGSIVLTVRAALDVRDGSVAAAAQSGASVEQSVGNYLKTLKLEPGVDAALVASEAMSVLAEVEIE